MDNNKKEKFETVVELPSLVLNVNGEVYPFIPEEDWNKWESNVAEINTFLENNTVRNNDVSLSEEEKTELYQEVQDLWHKSFGKVGEFNDIKYNLVLTRYEYQLLVTLLRDKLEYDVNTLFFAMELLTFIGGVLADDEAGKFTDDKTPKLFPINQTDMTLLYTLLTQHKCKGLGKQTLTFANIIRRIGDISKVINHMTNENSNISDHIQKTVMTWDDGVVAENLQPVVEGKVS